MSLPSFQTSVPDAPAARELVGQVLSATAAHTGRYFFAALVQSLAPALGTRYAFVCELLRRPASSTSSNGDDAAPGTHLDGRASVLAGWDGERLTGPLQYDLAGTPCERVVRGDVCNYPTGVSGLFPDDALLTRLRIHSYTGVALFDPATAEPIGLLAVLDDRPGEETGGQAGADLGADADGVPHDVAHEVLRVCAARASAELLRVRRDDAMRDVEQRFYSMAEASPVGIFKADARGEVEYVNPHLAALLGMSPSAALSNWRDALHPDDRARVLAASAGTALCGETGESEHRYHRADGRVVWVFTRVVPDRDAAGRIVGLVGTVVDVTERRLAAERLRTSQQHFEALAESSAVGIWHVELPAGGTSYMNPTMRAMLELAEGEDLAITGEHYEAFFTPETFAVVSAQLSKRLQGHTNVYEAELVGRRGRRTRVLISGAPVVGADGALIGRVGTFTDITERKRAEDALGASEARLRLLADEVPAILWTTDAELNFTSGMGAGLRKLGLAHDAYHGVNIRAIFGPATQDPGTGRTEADGGPAIDAHLWALTGEPRTYEMEWGGRYFHARVEPLRSAAGDVVGVVGVSLDITDLRSGERALRDSEARLRLLVEQVPANLWTTDRGLVITSSVGMAVRPRAIEMNAYAGLFLADLFGADAKGPVSNPGGGSGARAMEVHRRALAGEAGQYEQFWNAQSYQCRVRPLRDAQDAIVGTVGVALDVTERIRAEAELRQKSELLQSIVDHIPVMLHLMGPGDAYMMLNPEFVRVMGWTPDDLAGRDLLAECYPDPAYRRQVKAFVSEAQGRWADFRTRVKGGKVIDTAWTNLTLSGGLTLGIGQDISDRKRVEAELRESKLWLESRVQERTADLSTAVETLRAEIERRRRVEDELRESQQRYASILNSQQTLVSRSGPTGLITYQNAAHERVYGRRVGDNVLADIHPDDVAATAKAMEDLTRPPFTCSLEQRCRVDGKWRTFLWQGGVVRDRGGRVVEFQGVGFDITERRRAEELLQESMRLARRTADEARAAADRERRAAGEAREVAEFNRRLALEVDHRVRNNLAALLSLVGMMRGQTRDVASFASAIEGRLTAMTHVHQVLAETNWQSVDLRSLASSLMNAGARLCPHNVAATLDGPAVAISARQTPPLSMILMEWFTNSCKYGAHSGPGGHLSLTWSLVTRETPENVAARFVRLRWVESGGPPIRSAGKSSLGTLLVQSFAKLELKGTCELRFPEGGADHVLEFPVGEEHDKVNG